MSTQGLISDIVAVAVRLADPASELPEAYHVAAVLLPESGTSQHFSSLLRTRQPLSYRARLLAGDQPPDLESAPEPDAVAAHLVTLTRGRPLIYSGGAHV